MNEHQRELDVKLLVETTKSISKAKDFQLTSKVIFQFIQKLVNYNLIVIYKLKENEDTLEVVSALGSDTEIMKKRVPFKVGQGAIGHAAKAKKSLLVDDVFKSKDIKVRQYYDEDPLIRSFMAVPLVVEDKVIGILSVSHSKPYQYTEYHVQMISIIASQGAALLELNNNLSDIEKVSNQILENINSGVIVADSDLNITVFNHAAQDITGYLASEIVGKKLIEIPLKENGNHWHMVNSINRKKIYNDEKAYMIRKNGEYINIRLSTSLIYNEDNSVKKCICIFTDITEMEKLQRQITLTDKLSALGRLTAGITHEIRNPLLPIRNASEHLLKNYKDDGKNLETIKLLKIIIEESERLNRFLGQLSNLSRDSISSNGESDFKRVLDNTLLLLKYNLNSSGIQLDIDIDRGEIILPCSEDNLKQIILNIILNAIDAINKNYNNTKEINIEALIHEDHFILEIADTGIGMSKDEINNIFDPFYTTKEDGTGLGLPLSLNIVEKINGRILVESFLGVGSKVTLIIPTYGERML